MSNKFKHNNNFGTWFNDIFAVLMFLLHCGLQLAKSIGLFLLSFIIILMFILVILYLIILCFFFLDYFISGLDISLRLLSEHLDKIEESIFPMGIKTMNLGDAIVDFFEKKNNIFLPEFLKEFLKYDSSNCVVIFITDYWQPFWTQHYNFIVYIRRR